MLMNIIISDIVFKSMYWDVTFRVNVLGCNAVYNN